MMMTMMGGSCMHFGQRRGRTTVGVRLGFCDEELVLGEGFRMGKG